MSQPSPYTDHKGTMCVVGSSLIGPVIKRSMWDDWVKKCGLKQRGGNGRPSLIAFDLLPEKHRLILEERFGPPYEKAPNGLRERLQPDGQAAAFYSTYDIDPEKQAKYAASAMVMNAITSAFETEREARAAHGTGIGDFWQRAVDAVNEVKGEVGHNINVKNARALRRKWEKYRAKDGGYASLVHGGHGKQNALKRTYHLEKLLMSIYVMPNRPFSSDVKDYFDKFMKGEVEVFDKDTGEVYSPQLFTNGKGEPLTIGPTTVWNVLNDPQNRPIVDNVRMGRKRFNDIHRPHNDRHLPNYSFSKISLDDRDLPRKMHNGKRVKAYYAYDVASGAVVGRAYSQTKDHALLIDCIRDMFRMMFRNGWGMPLEIEVEKHLVKDYKEDLEKLYPYVRWCMTSQEKRAEHFNRSKKYGVEKKTQVDIGRWWAKSEAYQVDEDVVDNEYVGNRFDYEELVADDLEAIDEYNDGLHHKDKRFPNMTRMDVLRECMNPNLADLNLPVLMKMIGNRTQTTIRRNYRCQVNHRIYEIPNVETLAKLAVNNYEVQAYWLSDEDGKLPEVHLWQGEKFICTAALRNRYNEARGERKGADWVEMKRQKQVTKDFDEHVKERVDDLTKVGIEKTTFRDKPNIEEAKIVETPDHTDEQDATQIEFPTSLRERM